MQPRIASFRCGRGAMVALAVCTAAVLLISTPNAHAEQPNGSNADASLIEQFERSVRPIFIAHCIECHGPEKHEAELRLDSSEGLFGGGQSGPVLRPGDPDASRLIQLVRGTGDE